MALATRAQQEALLQLVSFASLSGAFSLASCILLWHISVHSHTVTRNMLSPSEFHRPGFLVCCSYEG